MFLVSPETNHPTWMITLAPRASPLISALRMGLRPSRPAPSKPRYMAAERRRRSCGSCLQLCVWWILGLKEIIWVENWYHDGLFGAKNVGWYLGLDLLFCESWSCKLETFVQKDVTDVYIRLLTFERIASTERQNQATEKDWKSCSTKMHQSASPLHMSLARTVNFLLKGGSHEPA